MTGPAPSPWHARPVRAALDAFAVDPARGLDTDEVAARRARHGANALPESPPRSALARIAGQFKSPLIYLLLAAAAIAVPLGETSDAIVIVVVVVINALIGAFQEGRAEQALAALRRMSSHEARVIRGGHEAVIASRDVVPGDVLVLAAGDAVAADARLVEGTALQLAEAALTGESTPVSKAGEPVDDHAPLAERYSMVYAGTHVTAGRARAVVVATGLESEIGHIATLAATAQAPKTPLERRVDHFGTLLMYAAAGVLVLVIGIGLLRGVPAGQIAMLGISQMVGMVPEGLPVAMTIALAVGVQRMAQRRAVVRRLSAVETLGSTTVICSDKTGTLTRNEMTVTALWLPEAGELTVTGAGYGPEGSFGRDGGPVSAESEPALRLLLEAAVLCNDADISGPVDDEPGWRAIGDPTEAALVTLAIKGGLVPAELRAEQPRQAEVPFDADIKMMATQHQGGAGPVVYVKGAPEVVLALCRARGSDLDDARVAAERMAARALRILAIAVIDGGVIDGATGVAGLAGRARLLGLVGQLDPPRPEVAAAVASCRAAGVRTVMVTGDHVITAGAIARDLGIADAGVRVVDGVELDGMSEADLAACVGEVGVFARVHPAQKLRIVAAHQRRGEVVAVTGDGVNDTPALVKADVGVAMGITGTEVAKEAAKIVITDDNFATIVAAVEEGRVVNRNIKKAILLLATTSLAEVAVLLAALALGYPAPFAAVQILWNNLVTEGVITVNLIMEPAEGDEMRARPTPTDEPLLTGAIMKRIALLTPTIVVITLGWFIWRLESGVAMPVAQTETFTLLVVCEWFNVLNCRSERRSGLDLGVLRNPWLVGGLVIGNLLQIAVVFMPSLNRVFHTVPIGLSQVLAIGVAASAVLWLEELRKLVVRRTAPAGTVRGPG